MKLTGIILAFFLPFSAIGAENELFKSSNLSLVELALNSISYAEKPEEVLGEHSQQDLATYICGQLGELSAYAYVLQSNGVQAGIHGYPSNKVILGLASELVFVSTDLLNENCGVADFNHEKVKRGLISSTGILNSIKVAIEVN